MIYDATAADAVFVEGKAPPDIDAILERVRSALGEPPPWRMISARRKLGRILFEVEEDTPRGPRRLIGKIGKTERAETLFRTLQALRDAGFAPPSRHCVPEPIAFIPDQGFVLQEKAPGIHAARLLATDGDRSHSAAVDCAAWLARLHGLRLPLPLSPTDAQAVWNQAKDLSAELPFHARRIVRIADAILKEVAAPVDCVVPSHGDFHPMNVLSFGDERVTGIDIDKAAFREPEADIGWFLMQTAAFAFFEKQSFHCTDSARRTFAESYETESGRRIRPRRVALYMAMAFLKNLHFELVLLKTGRTQYADRWLWAAESVALHGNWHLEP
jgi:aminoglycoside phosphotransferase (APT) family kinase protein